MSRDDDIGFMQQALALAGESASLGEVPVGAVLVLDGRVLGRGHNRSRLDSDPTAHAEVVALRAAAVSLQACRLDGATLYVTVEPCLMCCGALLQARVRRLVFGVREPRTGAAVSLIDSLSLPGLSHRIAIEEGLEAARSEALMQSFFQARR